MKTKTLLDELLLSKGVLEENLPKREEILKNSFISSAKDANEKVRIDKTSSQQIIVYNCNGGHVFNLIGMIFGHSSWKIRIRNGNPVLYNEGLKEISPIPFQQVPHQSGVIYLVSYATKLHEGMKSRADVYCMLSKKQNGGASGITNELPKKHYYKNNNNGHKR